MPPSILPLIAECDFSAFQQMIPEYRGLTFAEWRDDHLRVVAFKRWLNGSVEIPISPDEFDAWLKESKQVVRFELLWRFAKAKAARLSRPVPTIHDYVPFERDEVYN